MDKFDNDVEIQWESLNFFNFTSFREFLINKGVIAMAVSYVIGNQINYLVDSVLENIIHPLLEPDYNGDNINDFKSIKKMNLQAGPYTFKTGKFFYDLLKFILVMYSVFIISRLFIDTIN